MDKDSHASAFHVRFSSDRACTAEPPQSRLFGIPLSWLLPLGKFALRQDCNLADPVAWIPPIVLDLDNKTGFRPEGTYLYPSTIHPQKQRKVSRGIQTNN
jgi:hypothetical protein